MLAAPDCRVDCRDQSGGATPLLLAARAAREDCARLLVEQGADLDLRCGKVTPREVLAERIPGLNVTRIVVSGVILILIFITIIIVIFINITKIIIFNIIIITAIITIIIIIIIIITITIILIIIIV